MFSLSLNRGQIDEGARERYKCYFCSCSPLLQSLEVDARRLPLDGLWVRLCTAHRQPVSETFTCLVIGFRDDLRLSRQGKRERTHYGRNDRSA